RGSRDIIILVACFIAFPLRDWWLMDRAGPIRSRQYSYTTIFDLVNHQKHGQYRFMSSRPRPPQPANGHPVDPSEQVDSDRADQSWGTIIELCFSVRDWWAALCEELDLTPAQGLALRSLDRPLPMNVLADALACDASNVTGIVDKLESRGLIARRAA